MWTTTRARAKESKLEIDDDLEVVSNDKGNWMDERKGKVGETSKLRAALRLWARTSTRASGRKNRRAGVGNFKKDEHNGKEGGNLKIKDELWSWGRMSASNLKMEDERRVKWEGDLQVDDKH